MKIGIVLGRIGGPDGVALETEKWIQVLNRMGVETAILTGELEGPIPHASLLPEVAFSHPACQRGQDDAFFLQSVDENELADRLQDEADYLEKQILLWLRREAIDVLLTENATTLPCHLTLGMALKRVIETTGIRAVAHDHDFHWERGERYVTRYSVVKRIIEECFPPSLPNLRHAVINEHCQRRLRSEMGIESIVVPNVMDFDAPFGVRDDYNRQLANCLGLNEEDIPLYQITRIVRRKGIETAIELVHRLENPRTKLVISGTAADDYREEYLDELRQQMVDLGLERQIHFAGSRFNHRRSVDADGREIYSLSDGYAHARACTYFSTYEGFGNAFVEAVVAKRPVFVNNYRPVYWPDIGSKGFCTVQIEDGNLTDKAVHQVHEILHTPEKSRDWVEHNFELGRRYFSYQILEERLTELLTW